MAAEKKSEKKQKKGGGGADASDAVAKPTGASTTEIVPPRFLGKYKTDVIPALIKQLKTRSEEVATLAHDVESANKAKEKLAAVRFRLE